MERGWDRGSESWDRPSPLKLSWWLRPAGYVAILCLASLGFGLANPTGTIAWFGKSVPSWIAITVGLVVLTIDLLVSRAPIVGAVRRWRLEHKH